MRKISLQDLGKILLLSGIYFVAARYGLMMEAVGGVATSVWPPSGLSLAALLLFGYRLWPGVALGAFFANYFMGDSGPLAFGIAVGNTLEALIAALLLKRVFGFSNRFERLRDVMALFFGAAVLSTLISASIGVSSAVLTEKIAPSSWSQTWWTWWLGDMLGDLVVAPLLLTWSYLEAKRFSWKRSLEFSLLLFGAFVFSQISFGALNLGKGLPYPITYLIFPFLFWASLRFGPRGASATVAVISALAIWDTIRGIGPFVRPSLNQSLISVQFFIGTLAITAFILAAAFMERKRAEEAMRRHADDLQRLSQLKSEFASIVAHELRTPLTVIKEGIGMVLDGVDGEVNLQQAETLNLAKDNVDRLGRLITNVLDYEKLESGRLDLDIERADLASLIREVFAFMDLIAKKKGLNLHLEAPPEPVWLFCDPDKIREVLINLIDNAYKYSRETGDVWVRLRSEFASFVMEVEDTGRGIPKEDQATIFQMFRQTPQQGRSKIPGAGVGLAVCKKIVELHGGSISVSSEPGCGSKFAVILPRTEPLGSEAMNG